MKFIVIIVIVWLVYFRLVVLVILNLVFVRPTMVKFGEWAGHLKSPTLPPSFAFHPLSLPSISLSPSSNPFPTPPILSTPFHSTHPLPPLPSHILYLSLPLILYPHY